MKILKYNTPQEDILCMSNVRGRHVENPHKLPFSFFFSEGSVADTDIVHGPRVKPIFNPENFRRSLAGTLKLCDDWEFIPGKNDRNISNKDIKEMKNFFRTYLSMFCAVWDSQIDEDYLEEYFKGQRSFDEWIQELDFYEEYKSQLDEIHDVSEFEQFCRNTKVVDLYGN